ncbi:MAG: HEAT repeat domain-containing protein [Polyangiales bacterium]
MAKQALRPVALALLACAFCIALVGCHADDNDPKGQAGELNDPVRREHAIGRLSSLFSERLVAAKGNRSDAAVKQFADDTIEKLSQAYIDHPEDNQNGLKMLQLMSDMRDPRALPALLKALEWQAEVSEDHAVTAGATLATIDVPPGKRAEVVAKICAALKRVTGPRPVDNRMRKGFIEVLGKMKDKGATATLVEIALRQDDSQNFLFNKLAAQQLTKIADPAAVDALVKALYLFDPKQPMMRMEEDAEAALVAIGKPSLEPLLKAARGENPDVVKLVELSIESFRRKDQDVAAKMNKNTLVAREAVLALGRLGMREALDTLIKETTEDDGDRRMTASLALVSINRDAADTPKIVAAMTKVYDKSDKQARPQLLVAFRHLYADEGMPLLLKVAKTHEAELPPVQMYGWLSYALMANKDESVVLGPILEKEELIKPQLLDYQVALKAAEQCDKNVQCWLGKLKDKDKIVVRKATTMLARYARGNDAAIKGLIELFSHSDLEVRNEALSAVDFIAVKGSADAVNKIDALESVEAGRSIWNNFSREALPTRSRLLSRAAS